MKLGPITGNCVQVVPKRCDPNRPHGGATIKGKQCNFGNKTENKVSLIDLKFVTQVQLMVSPLGHIGAG